MEDIIKVCALGGLDENGRDCYVIEINNDLFVLDAGLALPDKTIPGVDYLLANAQYIINNKDRLKAYIITHAHDENMGALKYFYDDAPAPIICTRFTKHPRCRAMSCRAHRSLNKRREWQGPGLRECTRSRWPRRRRPDLQGSRTQHRVSPTARHL